MSELHEPQTGSLMQRQAEDAKSLTELISKIGVDPTKLEGVGRVGRPNQGKSRLLRFKCKDMSEKISILRNSKELRTSTNFRNVYADFTQLQRVRNGELRKEVQPEKRSCLKKFKFIVISDFVSNFR